MKPPKPSLSWVSPISASLTEGPLPCARNMKSPSNRCSASPWSASCPCANACGNKAGCAKGLILIVLAILWEAVARYQNNDLLLPSFLQTFHALYDGLAQWRAAEQSQHFAGGADQGLPDRHCAGICPDHPGGVDPTGPRPAQHPDLDVQPAAGDCAVAAGAAVVWPGPEQPDFRAGAFGVVGVGAQHLFGVSRRVRNPAHGRSQLRV